MTEGSAMAFTVSLSEASSDSVPVAYAYLGQDPNTHDEPRPDYHILRHRP